MVKSSHVKSIHPHEIKIDVITVVILINRDAYYRAYNAKNQGLSSRKVGTFLYIFRCVKVRQLASLKIYTSNLLFVDIYLRFVKLKGMYDYHQSCN
jgi:hypothetical protein